MIPITLQITGHFSTNIDVHAIPLPGCAVDYHGCKPDGGIVHIRGRVDTVKYTLGHKNPKAAIVFMSALYVHGSEEH